MTLREIQAIALDEGFAANISPVHRHVEVQADDADMEYLTLLIIEDDVIKEDYHILDREDKVVATNEDELRAFLQSLVG